MEPFKNIFNPTSVKLLSHALEAKSKSFDKKLFLAHTLPNLEQLELKQRVDLIEAALSVSLSGNFTQQSKVLVNILHKENFTKHKESTGIQGFIVWPLTQFIATYGQNNIDASMLALYEMTKRFTAEFAIRDFLNNSEKEVYSFLKKWVKDDNEHIRRLVSEGCRPNLPWGKKVLKSPYAKKLDFIFLEKLKNDKSKYVRTSVANHLNDYAHFEPQALISTVKKWKPQATPATAWIISRSLRTLLKKGNLDALRIQGFNPNAKCKFSKVSLTPKSIHEGETLELKFSITSLEKKQTAYMIDYIIYYPKKNQELSPKVFKLKNKTLSMNEKLLIIKKIHFKKVTTRTHYPGKHLLEVQINGKQVAKCSFELSSTL